MGKKKDKAIDIPENESFHDAVLLQLTGQKSASVPAGLLLEATDTTD